MREIKPYEHKVQYYETDRMQITHHSNYIRFMEEARTYFLEQIGWGYDRMEEEGIASPVLSVECDYRHSTTYADVISITVEVLELKGVRVKLGYTMTADGKTVCTGATTHCFLRENGRPLRIERDLPEFSLALKALMEDGRK